MRPSDVYVRDVEVPKYKGLYLYVLSTCRERVEHRFDNLMMFEAIAALELLNEKTLLVRTYAISNRVTAMM